jgi:hypothetical protein
MGRRNRHDHRRDVLAHDVRSEHLMGHDRHCRDWRIDYLWRILYVGHSPDIGRYAEAVVNREDEYSAAISERLRAKNRGYERAERDYIIISLLTAALIPYLTFHFLL